MNQFIKKSFEEQMNVDAPLFHVVPYVTGGFQRLLHMIKTDNVPELAEYGYHTNSEGHFDPKGECVIGLRYRVKKILDTKGQSAVLVLAQDEFSHKPVVIKVLHSHFYQLGGQESHVLRKLAVADPLNLSHTLRLLTTVAFDSHYCLIFEPLIPQPLTAVFSEIHSHRVLVDLRRVGLRLLASVGFLHQQNLIHTDLKPDNILLKHENDLDSVHIVDFGNTIHYVHSEISLYYKDFELQTPLYRAPEVMFGVPFGPEIDVWSLGCVLAELFLGKPLFLGTTKEEIMEQMTSLFGPFPSKIFRQGKYFRAYKKYTSEENQTNCTLKLLEHLQCKDVDFADLIGQMLKYDPEERLTVSEAARHPFFASYLPLTFLLPKSSGCTSYPGGLSKTVYNNSPYIPSDIRKQPLSSLDLLRQGTAKLPPFEDTKVIKPSPRRGVCSRNSLNQSRNTDLQGAAKETNEQPNKNTQSDISVVRNFIVSEDKRGFSKNVKDKMSALLEVIREEQNWVEEDLERRNTSAQSKCANKKAFDCVIPSEIVGRESNLQRPCPRYGRYHAEDEAGSGEKQSLLLQSNESRTVGGERVVHGTNRHEPKSESSHSKQKLQRKQADGTKQSERKQVDGTNKSERRWLSSRDSNTKSLYNGNDMAVKDGSPTFHGVKERNFIQQNRGNAKTYSYARENTVLEVQPESRNLVVCSTNSDKCAAGIEMSYISGSERDSSNGSDYDTDTSSDSSKADISHSSKSGSDKGSHPSSCSMRSKEVNRLKEQIRMRRVKRISRSKKETHLQHYSNEGTSFSNFSANINMTHFSSKHSRKKGDLHNNPDTKSPSVCTNAIVCSQIAPISNKTNFISELRSPGYSNRKRSISDIISDDEEYLELLSPMATKSNKKVKPENTGSCSKERYVTNGSPVANRKHEFSPGRYSETATDHRKSTETDTGIHMSNIRHPVSIPRLKHDRQNSQRTFPEVKNESKPILSKKVDLMPSAHWCPENLADYKGSSRKKMSPTVTPIRKEEKTFPVNKWESESPEIVYKRNTCVTENTGNCHKVNQPVSGFIRMEDVDLVKTKSQVFSKRSLASLKSLSGEKSRTISHKLLKRTSAGNSLDSELDKLKPVKRNSLDPAQQKLPGKVNDYMFRGTPDTDLKQLSSRGGYAERIAQISRKRKKARKSLEFDSRQSRSAGYIQEYSDGLLGGHSDARPEDRNDTLIENTQVCETEYRLPHRGSINSHLKTESINTVFCEGNELVHGKKKYTNEDRIKVRNQYKRKPTPCTEETSGVKFKRTVPHRKKDSTFTIEFESPFRDNK